MIGSDLAKDKICYCYTAKKAGSRALSQTASTLTGTPKNKGTLSDCFGDLCCHTELA